MANKTLSFSISDKDLAILKALRDNMNPSNFIPKIVAFLNRQSLLGAAFVTKTTLSGQILKRRTGELARAVTGRAEIVNGVPGVRIGIFRGPALKYARIQDEGGSIVPSQAGSLAIPINDAVTPAGVSKYQSPRLYPTQLKFVPFRNSGVARGALYPVEELKRIRTEHLTLRDARAAYILMKKVTLPERGWLSSGVRAFLPQLSSALSGFLKETFGANVLK